MKARKLPIVMPPNPAPIITERLLEIGLVDGGGMGPAPLSWREIAAWSDQTGVMLPAWESRLIRRLSTEYVAEGRRAEPESCPPPWRAPVTEDERRAEAAALDDILG